MPPPRFRACSIPSKRANTSPKRNDSKNNIKLSESSNACRKPSERWSPNLSDRAEDRRRNPVPWVRRLLLVPRCEAKIGGFTVLVKYCNPHQDRSARRRIASFQDVLGPQYYSSRPSSKNARDV